MVQAVTNEQRPSYAASGSYVPGYVPVGLDKGVRDQLHQFRQRFLNVDLRIERAMVSTAAEICMQAPDLLRKLHTDAELHLRYAPGPDEKAQGSQHAQTDSVLIKRWVKREVRTTAAAWGFDGADETINRVMVSAALRLVLAAEELHEKWVGLVADTVRWEVRQGFQTSKNKES
jgi:hypothetical protein